MNPQIFATIALHAKMHRKLDSAGTHYRDLLHRVERDAILAAKDDALFEQIEELKRELVRIKFA